MNIISPTITAYSVDEYRHQMEKIAPFSKHVHIDLMDGQFAETTSVSLEQSWWPKTMQADIHVMYKNPNSLLEELVHMHPRLVIAHAEADHISSFIHELHEHRIKTGIAILQDTPVEALHHFINVIDHVLVFSGHLGHHGGHADMQLLNKVRAIRQMSPRIEIGWDGGINTENIQQLKEAGVTVFNVGSTIHASENPESTYHHLKELIQ